MSAIPILTRDQYHLKVRQNVDYLKARLRLPSFFASESDQNKALCYFMERAVQIGEASFRISDLQLPLFVLARVLCEDFFTMYWISLSETNAKEYLRSVKSEMAKLIRANIGNKRARIRHIPTGKDVTSEFLPELEQHVAKKKTVEAIAMKSGLGKVYDILYRSGSLELHGNTFGLSERKSEMDEIAVAISAVNAFLRAILSVADNREHPLTADEVLTILNIRHIPGT